MAITTKEGRGVPWLLLMFSLPTRRASQRVGVWRQLQRFGAIALRDSGYLLPNSLANRERFEWLAASIRKYNGEASVVEVQSIDNLSREQLVGRFAEGRARDYQKLIRELQQFTSRGSHARPLARLSRLRRRFQGIVAMDFFGSPLRGRVEELFERAESTPRPAHGDGEGMRVSPREYVGRQWCTRPRPGIDRSASAWLIRRWIDPKARFLFAPETRVPRSAVPFDMYRGGFGHRGEDCTFETLAKAFRVRDRRVHVIGQIIHDADMGDDKFGRKEGLGIDAVLNGWAGQGVPDRELLERGMQLMEGLYQSLP